MKRRHLAPMTAKQRRDFQAYIETALMELTDYTSHVMHRRGPWIMQEQDILVKLGRHYGRSSEADQRGYMLPIAAYACEERAWKLTTATFVERHRVILPDNRKVLTTTACPFQIAYDPSGIPLAQADVHDRDGVHLAWAELFLGFQSVGIVREVLTGKRGVRPKISRKPLHYAGKLRWPGTNDILYEGEMTIEQEWIHTQLSALSITEIGRSVGHIDRSRDGQAIKRVLSVQVAQFTHRNIQDTPQGEIPTALGIAATRGWTQLELFEAILAEEL
jgi:hypothetical protein